MLWEMSKNTFSCYQAKYKTLNVDDYLIVGCILLSLVLLAVQVKA